MSDQASSDTTGSTEFKAGRPPAIKVGGMRVGASRPRQTSQNDGKDRKFASYDMSEFNCNAGENNNGIDDTHQADDEYSYGENELRISTNRVTGQMVSGTYVPIEKAFPTEAVKHIHDRQGVHPKHTYHNYSKRDEQHFINQPRKQ